MPRGREQSAGPSTVPAWVLRSNEGIESVLRVVRVSLVWSLLSLLGAVVVGTIPATCAAAHVFALAAEDRRPPVLRTMWKIWREELVRANLRALPFAVVQVSAVTALALALSGHGGGRALMVIGVATAAVTLGWSTVSLAILVAAPRVRRQDLILAWRLLLLAPGALPFPSLLLVVLILLWTVICLVVPLLGLLCGAGGAAQAARSVVGRRMEDLLERLAPAAQRIVTAGE